MIQSRYRALDGWRGVCALLVALEHFGVDGHYHPLTFFWSSYLCVDFFFVLSGFVITHAYRNHLGSISDAACFMMRRFGRLWPLHIVMLLAFGGFYLVTLRFRGLEMGEGSAASFFTNIALIHSLGFHDSVTWNQPSWSISTEFVTYGVFAIMMLLTRRTIWASAILALIGLAVLLLFSKLGMESNADFGFGFFRCIYGFSIGHIVYRLHDRIVARPAWLASAEIAVLGVTIAFFAIDTGLLRYLAPVLFEIVVFVFAQEAGVVSTLLKTRLAGLLGKWSYSIYMTHWLLAVLLYNVAITFQSKTGISIFEFRDVHGSNRWLIHIGGRLGSDLIAILYLSAVVVISSFTYSVIEIPGQRFFNRLVNNRIKAPAPLTTAGSLDGTLFPQHQMAAARPGMGP